MNCWSKWLDHWLQQLKQFIPSFVKDGDQVLREILNRHLPAHALLFVTDANSMYNNIDTDHAILVITWWLKDLAEKGELPPNFPLDAVLSAMVTIMRNKIFEFGGCYFLQLLGTAMGTLTEVMWATLYYAYHEVHTIISNHGNNLLYYTYISMTSLQSGWAISQPTGTPSAKTSTILEYSLGILTTSHQQV